MSEVFIFGQARKDEDEFFAIGFSFQKAEAGVIGIKNGKNYEFRHKLEDEDKRSAVFGELL